jgi:hypothetical protein
LESDMEEAGRILFGSEKTEEVFAK